MLITAGLWLAVPLALTLADGQSAQSAPTGHAAVELRTLAAMGVATPPGYTIGPDDRLAINFWKDKDLSADVVVRPDGRISLPLLNDVVAAGLTPDALREKLVQQAKRFVMDPTATV